MEFISSEEFLRQPKEVQEVFLEWWKPSIGDIFLSKTIIEDADIENGINSPIYEKHIHLITEKDIKKYGLEFFPNGIDALVTPLFTEGQLRKFIEDKTNGKVESYYAWDYYTIAIRDTGCGGDDPQCDTEETNLLQAYWKVACEIAKEIVENE